MIMGAPPPGFMGLLSEKYRLMGMEASAQAEQNRAQAQLMREQAGMVRPAGESVIAQNMAQTRLQQEQAAAVKPITESTVLGNLAQAEQSRAQANLLGAQAGAARTESRILNRITELPGFEGNQVRALIPSPSGLDSILDLEAIRLRNENEAARKKALGYKRGTARVPGKGSGDKVPAMLEPGEAILNKKAAGMIGRDKIAAANKKGNQMRTQAEKSKVAQLLKKLGMV